jgi:hypothetical protein
MSLSRSTRNAPWLRARKPGNSRERNMPIMDSMRMKRIGAALPAFRLVRARASV